MIYVANTAKVEGKARVMGNATVQGHAWIGGHGILEGDVTISSGWIWDVHWWKDIP